MTLIVIKGEFHVHRSCLHWFTVLLRSRFHKERNVLFCADTLNYVLALEAHPIFSVFSWAVWKCLHRPFSYQSHKNGHLCLRGKNVFKQHYNQLDVWKSCCALIQFSEGKYLPHKKQWIPCLWTDMAIQLFWDLAV